jgi:hypothetical protein
MFTSINFNKATAALAVLTVLVGLAACESESQEAPAVKEHVWKEQTQAIDKAREVETLLKNKKDQQTQ